MICWHYDHVLNRSIEGVNFLTALLDIDGVRLPVAVEFVKKDGWEHNKKTGKPKRKSSKTKNEHFREMIRRCHWNCRFDYVACDSWYSSAENMKRVKEELNSNFAMALKSNRKIALSVADKKANKYISIESLQPGQQTMEVWLEELDFPLLLTKQVFKDGDDTVGELYLACSDLPSGPQEYSSETRYNSGFLHFRFIFRVRLLFIVSTSIFINTQVINCLYFCSEPLIHTAYDQKRGQ